MNFLTGTLRVYGLELLEKHGLSITTLSY